MYKLRYFALALILCCFNLAAAAATLPAGVKAGASMGGISEYRLANGLQVLLLPDPSQDQITVNVTYLVGSREEGYGEYGMAHLLEHMMFKGTPSIPNTKGELSKRGGNFNGTTYFDRTNYFETFPASDKTLAFMLGLEADRMVHSKIAKVDLDSEMTVVRNEFERGENNPETLLSNRVRSVAYSWHNYGHSVIGTRSDIENVPIERLQAFYRKYYQPDNASLIVAGRFEPERALRVIAQTFGRIPRPQRKLIPTYTVEPPQDGEREVVLRRAGDVQMVQALYHIPPASHADAAPIDVLTQVLAMEPGGRLHKALIESGQASSIDGDDRLLREAGNVYFEARVRQGQSLDTARDTLLKAVESFAEQPVSAEEVERARTKLISDTDNLLRNTRGLAITLSEFVGMGDWRLLYWYRSQLDKVTPADVQRVALAYLRRNNRTLGLFYPTEHAQPVAIPAAPDIPVMLQDFKGPQAISLGESFDPSPQNIEARLLRQTLPSGMKLSLLPKKTRGSTVTAQLALHWGDADSKRNRSTACTLAGAMLSRGTRLHTREQLRDELNRLQAKVSVGVEFASVSTVRENLPEVLKLVAEMLRQPSFPADEFAQLKSESIAALEAQRNDPSTLASIALSRHLNPYAPGDWRYTPTLDERIAQMKATTVEQAQSCYHDLVGGSNSELAMVGDFDPQQAVTLATQLFGDWKSPQSYTRIPATYFEVAPLTEKIETPDKANAQLLGGMNLKLRDDDPDFPALVLGNYLLGGSTDARLWRRVREKDGLSYSVGSYVDAASLDQAGSFGLYAIYAPQNRTQVETAIKEELQRALQDGFDQKEFDDARDALLHARQIARNNDRQLSARLLKYAFIDRSFKWDIDLEQRIKALTPKEVQAALRRYIDMKQISYIEAGDFKAVAAKAQ